METFGQRFARLRKEKRLTQEDISKKVNISSQAVSKWENDISLPDISLLIELADLLEVTIDELLGKVKNETKIVLEKKDVNKMLVKIRVKSSDGDKVSINLPVVVIKALLDKGMNVPLSGNKSLEEVDFNQIMNLIEQGVVGELVNIESNEGDTISIIVE